MSATGFLILLIVTIALLMVLIMKVKLHPTFALFASALFMGLVLGRFEAEGFSFTEVLSLITSGFGGTLGSMGIPIMLGAILAMGVQDTGAAKAHCQLLHQAVPRQESGVGSRTDRLHRLHSRVRRYHHHPDLQHCQRALQA